MKFKTINSMAMIYILPAPANPLAIPRRPSGKSGDNNKKHAAISVKRHVLKKIIIF
jgi:hypothetical protein